MDIEFDPTKDAHNRAKHGVSLELARALDWRKGLLRPAKTVAGEPRWQRLDVFEGVVYSVIFTRRAGAIRPISVRPASEKERRAYAQEQEHRD